jgi:hypothetical protein
MRSVDLRVLSAEAVSGVSLHCVSSLEIGSPAEASVIGPPAAIGLPPRPTGSRHDARPRPDPPSRHASSPPPAVPGPRRRAGHPDVVRILADDPGYGDVIAGRGDGPGRPRLGLLTAPRKSPERPLAGVLDVPSNQSPRDEEPGRCGIRPPTRSRAHRGPHRQVIPRAFIAAVIGSEKNTGSTRSTMSPETSRKFRLFSPAGPGPAGPRCPSPPGGARPATAPT